MPDAEAAADEAARKDLREEPEWKRAPRWFLVSLISCLLLVCGGLFEHARSVSADDIADIKAQVRANRESVGRHEVTLEGQNVRIAMWAATAQETLNRIKSLEVEQYAALRRDAARAGDSVSVTRLTRKMREAQP